MWRGACGQEIPRAVTVESIEICMPGESDGGKLVDEAYWSERENFVVDLDNGHWAYGYQICPV